MSKYRDKPVLYCEKVLGVTLWEKQQEVCRKILEPPYRVLVKSSHSVGKSFLDACLVNWFFDCFPESVTVTTAPTLRDVCDLLWNYVRLQRQRAGLRMPFPGDKAPEMYDNPAHYAKGYTAVKGESFSGRHQRHMLFVFDEASGVDARYWTTQKTMFVPDGNHHAIATFNPVDDSCQAAQEEMLTDDAGTPLWHVVTMSSLDHPNLADGLAGHPVTYPGAVTLAQFEDWLASWCDPAAADERTPVDLEWPPGSGRWFRPGPEFEARALGRYPSQASASVWSDLAWQAAVAPRPWTPPRADLPEVGCDVARHGSDFTAIHTRWGTRSLGHERHNGWATDRTAGRLKELCRTLADRVNLVRERTARPVRPEEIPVKVDGDGLGAGVLDQRGGYRFIPVCASGRPLQPSRYPKRRDELWFMGREMALAGLLDLSALPPRTQALLRTQVKAPRWKLDGMGRRDVESKDEMKKRLAHSPDDADAMHLAFAVAVVAQPQAVDVPHHDRLKPREADEYREPDPIVTRHRGLFGGR